MLPNRNTVYLTERNAHISGIPLPFERCESHRDPSFEDIAIETRSDGQLWLVLKDDEGMGVDAEAMNKLLLDYYRENF